MKSILIFIFNIVLICSITILHRNLYSASSPTVAEISGFRKNLEEEIRRSLAQEQGFSKLDYQVIVESYQMKPVVDFDSRHDKVEIISLGRMAIKNRDGLFSFPAIIKKAKEQKSVFLTGVMTVVGPALVASKNLGRDKILQKEDLQVKSLPWKQLPSGAASIGINEVVGKRLKVSLGIGKVFHSQLVDDPFAVRSGELVDLTLHSGPGVMIRSKALAKENGKLGEEISLYIPQSKKRLNGLITGVKKVEVRL